MCKKSLNKLDYLNNHFNNDIKTYSLKSRLKTGLSSIDSQTNIRPGIFLIGGLPSVGKTSFALQLADKFAFDGNKVLFFSLEQSEYDLTVKTINRIKAQNDIDQDEAIDIFKSFAENIKTVTSDGLITIEDISCEIDSYVKEIGVAPIVFIDYLQLIGTASNMLKRDKVTYVSNQLAAIAKKYGVTIFVLSSLNRSNYMMQIDFESFKESGDLEYDADCVWGLELQVVSSDKFIDCTSVDRKRQMIADAKTADIRKVEIICLKNRFGKVMKKCRLDYHTDKDLFVDSEEECVEKGKRIKCI